MSGWPFDPMPDADQAPRPEVASPSTDAEHSNHPQQHASQPAPAPRVARAALLTWSRRDRRASGDVVLEITRDLIADGSSPWREARGILRSGLGMRRRGTVCDMRRAPWQAAAPATLIALATFLAVVVTTHLGGWHGLVASVTYALHPTSYGMNPDFVAGSAGGPDYPEQSIAVPLMGRLHALIPLAIVGGSLLLAALAWLGRRWLATATIAGLGVLVAIPYNGGYGLGEAAVWRRAGSADHVGDETFRQMVGTGISLDGLAGVLLFIAVLTAAAWAITGLLSGPTADAAPTHSGPAPGFGSGSLGLGHGAHAPWRRRLTTPRATATITLWAAILLVGPSLGRLIGDLLDAILGAHSTDGGSASEANTAYLIVVAMAGTYLVAALSRRRPAVALAATIVGAAGWVPAIWMGFSLLRIDLPGAMLIGEASAALLLWLYTSIVGIAFFAASVAETGRRQATAPRETLRA